MFFRAACAALLALCVLPTLAHAQSQNLTVGSPALPGDLLRFQGNRQAIGTGGIQGDSLGMGANPFSVRDRLGLGTCWRPDASGKPHAALCVGHDKDGNGIITLDSVAGAAAKKLYVRINGEIYDLGAILAGGIVAPPVSMGAILVNSDGHLLLNGSGDILLN